jgi:hypothetical protein
VVAKPLPEDSFIHHRKQDGESRKNLAPFGLLRALYLFRAFSYASSDATDGRSEVPTEESNAIPSGFIFECLFLKPSHLTWTMNMLRTYTCSKACLPSPMLLHFVRTD